MQANWSWYELTETQKKWVLTAISALAVLIGVTLSIVMRTTVEKVKPVVMPVPAMPRPSDAAREAARQAVLKQLNWAEVQAVAGLEPQLAAVKEFFAAARKRTRAYGETVLSFDSKWKLVADTATGRKDHAAWLQAQFDQKLFSKSELDQLVQQVVAAYLQHTQHVESELLVRLKQDLEQLPAGSLPQIVDEKMLHAKLSQALEQAKSAVQAELGMAVGREVISYVAGEVLGYAMTQLAISSGILTTGAGSGWATLGVGVIVGIVVDAIVSEVYRQQFDPVGKIAGLLNHKLSEMESLIVKGTEKSPGLELRLRDYTTRRNAARRHAIQHAVLAP